MTTERDNSLNIAAAYIRATIVASGEFADAKAIVLGSAFDQCRGRSVAEMRTLCGYSNVLAAHIANLPEMYRENRGSRLFPCSVTNVLSMSLGELREELQRRLNEVPCAVCGRDTTPERQAHCRQCQLDDDALGEERE